MEHTFIRDGIEVSGRAAMEDALRQQKTLWRYVGIFTIVVLVLYILFIIGAIAFAVMYGSMPHPRLRLLGSSMTQAGAKTDAILSRRTPHRLVAAFLLVFLVMPCLAIGAVVPSPATQAPVASSVSSAVISRYVEGLEQRAAQDRARDEICLGEMYQSGFGVPRDLDKAIAWLKKATAQGDPEGASVLTMAYRQANNFIDFQSALAKAQVLAHKGNPDAEYVLGIMYFSGLDFPWIRINYTKALFWFQKAAYQGNAAAETMLAFMYQRSWGVRASPASARMWRKKAAQHSFECYVSYALSTITLIESDMRVPRDLLSGKVSGTVTLLMPDPLGQGARPTLLKSSGHPELDHAVLAAAADQILPTWTYAEKGNKFPLSFTLERSLFDPAIIGKYLSYRFRLENAVFKNDSRLWANQPYRTTATRQAVVRFECNHEHTQAVTVTASSGVAIVDRLSREAVEQSHCPPWPGGVALAKLFTFSLSDPWDGGFFNDPKDTPQTPYAMYVRMAIAQAEVVPRHALLYGTTGTGITVIMFKVRDGTISDIRVVKPSGDPEIDAAALAAARYAKLPKTPSSLMGRTVTMTMHVNFPVQSPSLKPETKAPGADTQK